jgi:cell division protein FtsI/penicillin-binding protein 2
MKVIKQTVQQKAMRNVRGAQKTGTAEVVEQLSDPKQLTCLMAAPATLAKG